MRNVIAELYKNKLDEQAKASVQQESAIVVESTVDPITKSIIDSKINSRKILENTTNNIHNIENTLMELAIGTIFDKIIEEEAGDQNDYIIGHRTIKAFVNEAGYANLIKRFSTQNLILSEMARLCESYKEAILESDKKDQSKFNDGLKSAVFSGASKLAENMDKGTAKLGAKIRETGSKAKTMISSMRENKDAIQSKLDDTCYKLDKSVADNFVDDIKDLVPNRAIKIIRARVADSMEEFLNQNADNKSAILDIYNKTATKVNTLKDDAESIKESYIQTSKIQANKVYDRSTNLLGAMINEFANKIIKNDKLKADYVNENGALDMKKIVNANVVMYTVLEELNSMEMMDFTPEYIQETLKSIG